ncbi:MAG TPA: ABC transporter permease [Bryobacteraceae bacterium]|nr:ABC transporter permease [Bryobacteraceae bacterium]
MYLSRWLDVVRARIRSLLRRGQVESELEKELRFHLEQQAEANRAEGMPAVEARLKATHRLGGTAQISEECRDARRTNAVADMLQDLRYAARTFVRTPGFSAAIVLTMALAIGANTAIFSVVHGVLLRPLPYPHADQMVRLFLNSSEFPKFPLNPFDLRDYRDRSRSFESLAGYSRDDLQLSRTGKPEKLTGFAVTSGFFHVLGAKPMIGREFTRREELPSNGHFVVLSNQLWRSRFAADPAVLGQKTILNGEAYTIVGVMPQGLEHPGNDYHAVAYGKPVDVWIPFPFKDDPANRGSHFMDGIGRLKNGVSLGQAKTEINAVMAQLAREHEGDRNWRVNLTPLHREIVGGTRRLLWILLGAVSVVLLIACVNAANLLLARATVREREIALRSALGARRGRLARQLLTESILISLAGAALGAVLAVAGVKVLVSLLPADFPRASDIHVNALLFLFALVVALVTGVLFGLAPAWQGSAIDLRHSLHEGSRGVTNSRGSLRLRNTLVVSEVALACLLLIGGGLMLRSFVNLLRTDPGFRPAGVTAASISLRTPNYDSVKPEVISRFYEQLISHIAHQPGVTIVGAGTDLPWTGYNENTGFIIEGKQPPPHSDFHARYHTASPDYFRALGIPLLRGRFSKAHDSKDGRRSLIINRATERLYWPGENAVGKRISFEDHPKEKDWLTVIGVVGDVKDTPASDAAEPAFWWSLREAPFLDMAVVVRGNLPPEKLASYIRTAVHDLDPNLAVADVQSMQEVVAQNYASARFSLLLTGLFALLALTLAAIGTYGVISYSMNQRRHEFGLRIALGAQPNDVLAFVFRQGMKLAIAGTVIGLLCSLLFGHVLGSLLYQVNEHDPLTMAGAFLAALMAAAAACYVPARRATHNDPMNSLRAD